MRKRQGGLLKDKHPPHNNTFPRQQKGWESKSMSGFQQTKGCFFIPRSSHKLSKIHLPLGITDQKNSTFSL